MRLHELIKSVPWSAIEPALSGHYNSGESFTEKHQKVFERLIVLEPVTNPMVLIINKHTEDGEDYVDITGENGTKNRDMPDFKYMNIPDNDPRADALVGFAIEFEPWQKWLGMTVHPDTLANFPPEEIIAHCLWEMTFIGFEEPKIQAEHDKLETLVEDIKAGRAKMSGPYNNAKEMFDDIMKRKDDRDVGKENS